MKTILSVLLGSILLSISNISITNAQEIDKEEQNAKIILSLVPQYTFIGGIRLDIDKRIGNTGNYLTFAPQFYSNNNDLFWSFDYDQLTGLGLKAYHRYFMVNKPNPKGLYVQYGLSYNYTRLTYTTIDWVDTDFGGTEAQIEDEVTGIDHIHKMGGDLIIGVQTTSFENLMIDFYLGVGYRGSKYAGSRSDFDLDYIGILNPAYSGILPIGGVRIGVFF